MVFIFGLMEPIENNALLTYCSVYILKLCLRMLIENHLGCMDFIISSLTFSAILGSTIAKAALICCTF